MKCRSIDTTEAFLTSTAVFFAGREAENTILLGVLRHMADRANPASNSIYRRLGYREIEALRIISFPNPE